MTEQTQLNSPPTTQPTGAAPTPVVDNSSVSTSVPTEKMLSQSEVDRIAANVRKEATEKALSSMQNQSANHPQPPPPSSQNSGPVGVDVGQLANKVSELEQTIATKEQATLQAQQEAQAQQYVSNLVTQLTPKILDAQKKYSDFDDLMKQSQIGNDIVILELANQVDNSGDVLHELSSNPSKLINLKNLADYNPQLALSELHKLSSSIKNNEASVSAPLAPEPLRQVNHSTIGKDNGEKSLSDLKALYRN